MKDSLVQFVRRYAPAVPATEVRMLIVKYTMAAPDGHVFCDTAFFADKADLIALTNHGESIWRPDGTLIAPPIRFPGCVRIGTQGSEFHSLLKHFFPLKG